MGGISGRASNRWGDKVPKQADAEVLTWRAIRDVLFPMMQEMADEIEGMRAELAEMRESKRKRRG